jgi:hypothetical protein
MSSQTRWKLLGVLVILSVVLGVVGWQQFAPRPMPPTTIMVTPTVTTVAGSQTTVVSISSPRLFKLFGKIFFDYNGNGKQEENEPPISGVTIALNGYNVTSSNSTGWYVIDKVPYGMNTIRPFPPKNLRYMCESASEFRSVEEPYRVLVSEDARKDIGLMEGFLTIPFAERTDYKISFFVNISNSSRPIDWQGGSRTAFVSPEHRAAQTGEPHAGTDYDVREMTPIIAAAPGIVYAISLNTAGGGHTVFVKHSDGYITGYSHLKEVKVQMNQILRRGDLIGLSGTGVTGHVHLHFGVDKPPSLREFRRGGQYFVDPYRSLVPPLGSPFSLWTKDNDPQFPQ